MSQIEQVIEFESAIPKNILNTNATGWEDGAVSSTGAIVTAGYDGIVTSPFIAVEASKSIISTRLATDTSRMEMGLTVVAYYDNNKSFISRITGTGTFTVPNNINYIRISGVKVYLQTSAATYKPMLNYGTTIDPHEEYFDPYIKSERLDDIESDIVGLQDQLDDIDNVTTYTSKNLINPSKWNTDGQYNNSDAGAAGGHTSNTDYRSYDDLIEVKPSTHYMLTINNSVVYAVTLLMVDSTGSTKTGGSYTFYGNFETTSNTKYLRISLVAADINKNIMLCEGSTVIPFEPWFAPYTTGIRQEVDSLLQEVPNESGSIVCWGDSLTYGSGATTGNTYPEKLATLTGKTVYRCGFPADTSDEIAGYQGAMPLVIAPVTIPASGSVNVDVYAYNRDPNGYPFGYPSIDAQNINPVEIAGIKGNLDLSASGSNTNNRTFVFTRMESGEETTLIDYTEIITKCSIDRQRDISIIWVGANGGWEIPNYSILISQIRNMVEYQDIIIKKYIILGLASGIQPSYAEALAKEMILAFGNHFIDIKDYLIRCGLTENGLTPTTQDEQDIEDGKVPTSLRVDSVHLNDYGYNSVASAVYTRGKILGYWS